MGSDKKIGATSDAGDPLKALKRHDFGMPDPDQMRVAAGTNALEASTGYMAAMRQFGGYAAAKTMSYLSVVLKDCEDAEQSIAALQNLDEEISVMLKRLEGEASPGVTQPGTEKSGGTNLGQQEW